MPKQPKNPLAIDLNEQLRTCYPTVFSLLSELGRRIYLPKGILSQSAEASAGAMRFNATRAVAVSGDDMMHLPVLRELVPELSVEDVFGYAPVLGQPELRQRWASHLRATNKALAGKAFSLPVVTTGMTHGFSLLAELFVNPGDTLILPDKIWGNYRLIFETKAGAILQNFPFYITGNRFNSPGFREALLKPPYGKRLILLNFPHNPTGYAISEDEAKRIVDAVVACAEMGNSVLIMVDDAYAGFWYDESVMHESLFGRLLGCHPNVVPVKIDGATKEEYAWGLRIGFLTFGLEANAVPPLEQKLSGLLRANTSGAPQLSQTVLLRAMNAAGHAEQKRRNYEILTMRAVKVKQIASAERYAGLWELYPFHAGYFACLRLRSANAERVRQTLLTEHGIGVIALGDAAGGTELRIAYSCLDESDIETVFEAIAEVVAAEMRKR